MIAALSEFTPKHRRLVAIDSDGCAIDSMEIKHRVCFGPAAVEQWGLNDINDEFLARWNEINLYSRTRGINRFKGLAQIFEEFELDGWQEIKEWTQRAPSLSNDSLAAETSPTLKKVLEWSKKVNAAIEVLPMPAPFAGVKEALSLMPQQADLFVVSSANFEAIKREWEAGEILPNVAMILSQRDGSKSEILSALLKKGYERADVLMIGDAPGDMLAAVENKVEFYPIMPGDEPRSWDILINKAWDEFLSGELSKEYQERFAEKLGL